MLFQFQTPDIFFHLHSGEGIVFFQCVIISRPLHWRYDTYFQVTAELAVTMLISKSLRGWRLRRLFPGRCGVGGHNAYSQVRNRDWSDLFPGRCRVGGYDAYSQVCIRDWRLRRLFPGPQRRFVVRNRLRRLCAGRCWGRGEGVEK